MMAGGDDTLPIHEKPAPCPDKSVLMIQGDHGNYGCFVFLGQVRDGVLGKRIPLGKEQETGSGEEKQ